MLSLALDAARSSPCRWWCWGTAGCARRRAARASSPRSASSPARPARPGRGTSPPPLLLLAALVLLFVALARPEATVPQPRREGTVILAFDVSASMAAKDIEPTGSTPPRPPRATSCSSSPRPCGSASWRSAAAGSITQEPTTDQADGGRRDRPAHPAGRHRARARAADRALGHRRARPVLLDSGPATARAAGPDLGYYGSAAVILLSDGENTTGPTRSTSPTSHPGPG